MNTDKLKLFKSEEEVAHFARVNGYDPEDADKLIADWKALGQPKKTITKKVSMLAPEEDSLVEKK
tara:strand:+ start:1923 stop:2117 length:195 start_codon:yes stop_codon:yes gene_type:complete